MEKKTKIVILGILTTILVAGALWLHFTRIKKNENTNVGTFENIGLLEESGKMKDSRSSDWWLNSGGVMTMRDNEANVNLGPLSEGSKWQKTYKKTNSRDTDDGYYPQNIFRLVTRNSFQNLTQELYFNIDRINMSDSSYRDGSNGVLLFNRYQDGDNLYYTGLRVDGDAVIKKKINGKYYTMAEKKVFPNKDKYDRESNSNLIPTNSWIGIKSGVTNGSGNSVNIKLYVDKSGDNNWELILDVSDKGNRYGKAPFLTDGYAGIRTDFMDVKFRDYKVSEIN